MNKRNKRKWPKKKPHSTNPGSDITWPKPIPTRPTMQVKPGQRLIIENKTYMLVKKECKWVLKPIRGKMVADKTKAEKPTNEKHKTVNGIFIETVETSSKHDPNAETRIQSGHTPNHGGNK